SSAYNGDSADAALGNFLGGAGQAGATGAFLDGVEGFGNGVATSSGLSWILNSLGAGTGGIPTSAYFGHNAAFGTGQQIGEAWGTVITLVEAGGKGIVQGGAEILAKGGGAFAEITNSLHTDYNLASLAEAGIPAVENGSWWTTAAQKIGNAWQFMEDAGSPLATAAQGAATSLAESTFGNAVLTSSGGMGLGVVSTADLAKFGFSTAEFTNALGDLADQANALDAAQASGGTGTGACVADSEDPNSIAVSPAGTGSGGWVTPQPLTYVVHFQNDPSASAAAQDIRVVLPLAPGLDPSTIEPGAGSYAGTQFAYDASTNTVSWVLAGIDLPPDKSPPAGEGWVSFTVSPKAGLASGTAISESAQVFFDYNPPISTPVVRSTIDSSPPALVMNALPATVYGGPVTVSWQATSPAGVADSVVYVSEDGGALAPYAVTSGDAAVIDTTAGHTYGVAVVATDALGVTDPVPSTAPLTFTPVPAPTTTAVSAPATVSYGQPATLRATVTTTAPGVANPPAGDKVILALHQGSSAPSSCVATLPGGTTDTASCTIPAGLDAGTYQVVATYQGSGASGGDPNYLTSSNDTGSLVVDPAPTALVAAAVSVIQSLTGSKVTYSAALSSKVTGQPLSGEQVAFSIPGTGATLGSLTGASCSATTDVQGVASCTVSVLNVVPGALSGGYEAAFAGTGNYLGSKATGALVVGTP
ncbi:MAG: DUF7619 domain-containing protein, partial [Acidimicrobiales bacterium]